MIERGLGLKKRQWERSDLRWIIGVVRPPTSSCHCFPNHFLSSTARLVFMTWDSGHGNERILKVSDLQETLEVIQASQKGMKRKKEQGNVNFP